jgi:DNA-binding FadR family transcriptional regulator
MALDDQTSATADDPSPTMWNTSAIGRQVRVPKTAELVADHLRRQIVRGELTEGHALPPEATLMEQFGVSRPTLREAFRVLESEALITVRRGAHGGARVHPPTGEVAARYAALILEHRSTTLGDIHDARAVLEAPCARRVAASRSDGDVDLLRRAVGEAEAALEDPTAFARINLAFHALLVDLAGNQTLSVMAGMLRHIIDLANDAHAAAEAPGATPRRANRKGFRAHQQLVELIAGGDATGAEELWRDHLAATEDYLVDVPRARTVLDLLG